MKTTLFCSTTNHWCRGICCRGHSGAWPRTGRNVIDETHSGSETSNAKLNVLADLYQFISHALFPACRGNQWNLTCGKKVTFCV